jgi:ABC-type bacteriocin/lantibiotic exporter with double-glycine peptidase domain
VSWIKNNEWLQPDRETGIRWSELRRFASHYGAFRSRLWLGGFLALLGSLSTAFIPSIFRVVQQALVGRDAALLAKALGAFLAVALLEVATSYAIGAQRAFVSTRLNRQLVLDYYRRLLNLSVEAFIEFRQRTNLFQRIIDAMQITPQFTEVLIRGGQAVIVLAVLSVVIGLVAPLVLGVIALGAGLLFAHVYRQSKRLRTLRQASLALNYPLVGKMTEVIGGLFTIKALSASLRVTSDVQRLVEGKTDAELAEYRGELGSAQIANAIRNLTLVVAVGTSFSLLLAGRLGLAEVFALYFLTNLALGPVSELAAYFQSLSRLSVNVASYYQVLDLPDEAQEAIAARARRLEAASAAPPLVVTAPAPAPVPVESREVRGAIEIRDLHFGYRNSPPLLTGLDLSIRPGERISLIGKSGAGKTTLFRLLLGFLQPQAGSLQVDGEEVAELVDKTSYRKRFGVVSQQDFFFGTSLRENLAFGLEEKLEEERIVEALERVNLASVVARFERGLDTHYSEDLFSGGQKQRFFIARALLRRPSIVLLDEPTSALDFENERLVMEAVDTLVGGKTTLTIAHRLSTVSSSDRVVVLHDGRVEAAGPHHELYETNRYYRELCDYNSFVV